MIPDPPSLYHQAQGIPAVQSVPIEAEQHGTYASGTDRQEPTFDRQPAPICPLPTVPSQNKSPQYMVRPGLVGQGPKPTTQTLLISYQTQPQNQPQNQPRSQDKSHDSSHFDNYQRHPSGNLLMNHYNAPTAPRNVAPQMQEVCPRVGFSPTSTRHRFFSRHIHQIQSTILTTDLCWSLRRPREQLPCNQRMNLCYVLSQVTLQIHLLQSLVRARLKCVEAFPRFLRIRLVLLFRSRPSHRKRWCYPGAHRPLRSPPKNGIRTV